MRASSRWRRAGVGVSPCLAVDVGLSGQSVDCCGSCQVRKMKFWVLFFDWRTCVLYA